MTRHDLNMTRFSQYWRRGVRSGWAYFVVWANCRAGSERLWLRRNAANLIEVSLWLGLLLLGALLWQWWGVALPVAMLLARTVWIASRVRHRAGSWGLSLLYGLNCQVVRIPVLVGQCRGLWYLVRRRPARLIEYKD